MSRLAEFIADGRVHVFDGAMGTMLYDRGIFVNVCYDELNLREPEQVEDVHRAYVRAGAEILETNTFGANPVKLSAYGLEERTEEINRAAVALARRAANGRAAVAGAIGPLGIRIEPWGPTSRDEAAAFFARQVSGLLEGGVDGFVLETFADLDEIEAAFRAVRRLTDLPVVAQMTVGEDGDTPYGAPAETIAARLAALGADVVGLNCSVGPVPMLDAVERMAGATDRPLSAQPNAGLPRAVGDRRIYLSSPEYMARYARRLIRAGVRFVGGCCGTTPDHIRKIRDYVTTLQPRMIAPGAPAVAAPETRAAEPAPMAERSELGRRLAAGQFVTSVELLPPRGWDPAALVDQARTLHAAGVDAVSVLDSPRAHSRMGVLAAAMLIRHEVGIEPIVHYTCRDRNMLGMVSDLLGAAAVGLRNVLLVTGDPPVMGPYPDTTAVFDIDSIGLTNVVHQLNRGLDPGGNSIGPPTRFVIGVAFNQGAGDLERELERLAWKVEAGAEFIVTQPVFDAAGLVRILPRVLALGLPVLAGLWPFLSLRNAEFLANEVPGIVIPPATLERMRGAQEHGAEAALAEGVAIAREVLDALDGAVAGAQVSAPFGRVPLALEVLAGRFSPPAVR